MPLDGVAVSAIVHQLKTTIIGGRIDKISQPEGDEIFINVRAAGANHKLLLTVNANAPRISFTTQSKIAPLKAPMFSMVLRKHLTAGRILDISQPHMERIVRLDIEAMDEMGDKATKTLVIEIMGKHSNIMLLDKNEKILDAIKHVSLSVSTVRPIMPGVTYTLPPSQGKVNPMDITDGNHFATTILPDNHKIQEALFKKLNGISPVLASEICARANVGADIFVKDLSPIEMAALYKALAKITTAIAQGDFSHNIYWDDTGAAVDIATMPMTTYASHNPQSFGDISTMLEAFYTTRDEIYRIRQKTVDLRKLINTHIERARKKNFVYEKTLNDIKNRDQLRIKGELITAYLYMIEKGAKKFGAENFYDDNKIMEITLDPDLTAAENAQRYFKKYNKEKRTFEALGPQMAKNQEDIDYLETVATAMETINDEADIAQIREELAELGFAKKKTGANKNKKAQQPAKPIKYISTDGFEIYVGKNNTQNDELTLKRATNQDIWLHTKDIPGSHVIVITGGKPLPDTTLLEAANLAAYNSRSKNSTNVPVDYVEKRHVRKPNGAKPGFVIYDSHKTVHVNPEETKLSPL